MTATVAAGAGAEAMAYGSVAFISNMDGSRTARVAYGGNVFALPNHTVAIVNTSDGRVLFNSSELYADELYSSSSPQVEVHVLQFRRFVQLFSIDDLDSPSRRQPRHFERIRTLARPLAIDFFCTFSRPRQLPSPSKTRRRLERRRA